MATHAVFFKFTGDAVARVIEHPSDRVAAVSRALEQVGGTVDAYYWMFGAHDGFVVATTPDSLSAAAVSLAVGSTGAFSHLETHELLTTEQIDTVLAKAKSVREAYRPPGAS